MEPTPSDNIEEPVDAESWIKLNWPFAVGGLLFVIILIYIVKTTCFSDKEKDITGPIPPASESEEEVGPNAKGKSEEEEEPDLKDPGLEANLDNPGAKTNLDNAEAVKNPSVPDPAPVTKPEPGPGLKLPAKPISDKDFSTFLKNVENGKKPEIPAGISDEQRLRMFERVKSSIARTKSLAKAKSGVVKEKLGFAENYSRAEVQKSLSAGTSISSSSCYAHKPSSVEPIVAINMFVFALHDLPGTGMMLPCHDKFMYFVTDIVTGDPDAEISIFNRFLDLSGNVQRQLKNLKGPKK